MWRILEKLPFGIPCEDPPGRRVVTPRARAGRARDGHDPRGREEHPPPSPLGAYYVIRCIITTANTTVWDTAIAVTGRLPAVSAASLRWNIYNSSRSRRKTNRNRRRTGLTTTTTETLKHENFYARYVAFSTHGHGTARCIISQLRIAANTMFYDRRVAAAAVFDF